MPPRSSQRGRGKLAGFQKLLKPTLENDTPGFVRGCCPSNQRMPDKLVLACHDLTPIYRPKDGMPRTRKESTTMAKAAEGWRRLG